MPPREEKGNTVCACGKQEAAPVQTEAPQAAAPAESGEITITDMIGREVTIIPGGYQKIDTAAFFG